MFCNQPIIFVYFGAKNCCERISSSLSSAISIYQTFNFCPTDFLDGQDTGDQEAHSSNHWDLAVTSDKQSLTGSQFSDDDTGVNTEITEQNNVNDDNEIRIRGRARQCL